MALTGTIEDIIYRNEENGYTVARLEKDDSIVTVVGKFIDIQVGSLVSLNGKFEKTKYGVQYVFETYEISMPNLLKALKNIWEADLLKVLDQSLQRRL